MRDNKENNNTNKFKIEKVLVLLTTILTISQIFNIFYSIYSKIYTSLDKFLITTNMVLFSLVIFLLVALISFLVLNIILRCLSLKEYAQPNITFKKFLFKNIILFITTCIFLIEFMSSFSLYFFYRIEIMDIIIYIMLLLPSALGIFIYAYVNHMEKDKVYKNKVIDFISTSKPLTTILLTYAFIFNLIFCLTIYDLPNKFYGLEKEIENDKNIKYEIIIDKLTNKLGINVTDEDIEQYKKELKEKYKMEE